MPKHIAFQIHFSAKISSTIFFPQIITYLEVTLRFRKLILAAINQNCLFMNISSCKIKMSMTLFEKTNYPNEHNKKGSVLPYILKTLRCITAGILRRDGMFHELCFSYELRFSTISRKDLIGCPLVKVKFTTILSVLL